MKNYLPDKKAPARIPDPTMSESLEMRWFIEDCPVLGGWQARSEARLVEDLYAFPCGVKWGSKLREGALELKTRRGKPMVCEMGD